MSIFPTLADVQSIAAPIVADAATQLGSRVDIYMVRPERQRDGSSKKTPQLVGHDIALRLKSLTAEQAQQIFGKESTVEMRGSMARSVVVGSDYVIEVISGEFAGQWFIVQKLIEKPLSDSYVLGLITTKALR